MTVPHWIRITLLITAVCSSSIILTAMPGSAGAPGTPSQLCTQGETILIGFQMKKSSKFAAICTNKKEDYIVYRFGTPAKVDLEYPKEKKDSWNKFTYKRDGIGCDHRVGLAASLVFQNGPVRYRVREVCGLQPIETLKQDQDNTPTYSYSIEVTDTKTNKTTSLEGREPHEGSLDLGPMCGEDSDKGKKALDRIDCEKDRG